MLISVHIPKTAGTTFRELLASHFGDELCLFYGGLKNSRMEPVADIPPGTRCIHGHIHARDFDGRSRDIERLTWLRDPVERVVSEYEHYRRSPDPQNEVSCLAARAGLLEFAEHPLVRNTQPRVFQGLSVADFVFVGISEFFDAELERLAKMTGIRLPPGHRTNVNPNRRSVRYPLTVEERRVLSRLNREAVELYREAVAAADLGLGMVA